MKIGEELKKKRLKKGLNYEDIFKKLKIHPRVLQALEEERFDYFSSALYAKSFLRKYAQFLNINKDLIQESEKEIEEIFKEKKKEILISSPRWLPGKEKIMLSLKIIVSSLLAITMIFLVFSITGKISRNLFTRKQPPIKKEEIKTTKVKNQIITTPILLEIKAIDDSWMELKADGKTIFEGILRKDSYEKWQTKKEFEIWVGKADALDFTVNGKHYGVLGKGIIKGIKINSKGIKLP